MIEHTVKCWPNYWDAIERGEKTFEVRLDDRGYQKGDIIALQKFDPKSYTYVMESPDISAKPKTIRRRISYVLTGGQMGVQPGYVVLALGVHV